MVPNFRAGLHAGHVVISECGSYAPPACLFRRYRERDGAAAGALQGGWPEFIGVCRPVAPYEAEPAFAVEPLGEARLRAARRLSRCLPSSAVADLADGFNFAAPAATRPSSRADGLRCSRSEIIRAALSPCPARRHATMKVSSHNWRWAWLPPIRTSSGISGSRMRTAPLMVAFGESLDAAAEADRAAARGELAVGRARFHLRQPLSARRRGWLPPPPAHSEHRQNGRPPAGRIGRHRRITSRQCGSSPVWPASDSRHSSEAPYPSTRSEAGTANRPA